MKYAFRCPCRRSPCIVKDAYGTHVFCDHCHDPSEGAGELSLLGVAHENEDVAIETWNERVSLYKEEAA